MYRDQRSRYGARDGSTCPRSFRDKLKLIWETSRNLGNQATCSASNQFYRPMPFSGLKRNPFPLVRMNIALSP